MRRLALGFVVLAAMALAWPGIAAADGVDEAASTELFNAGRDLMRTGDFAAACPKLAESARLKPTVGALAKLAECEEHEHRLVAAYSRWKQALNLALSLGDARAGDVDRELARLDRLVPKLRVVAGAALPPDALIRVDDMSLSTAGLGVSLPVAAGSHVVAASAAHAKTWSTTVEVPEGGATTSVTLPALEELPNATDARATPATVASREEGALATPRGPPGTRNRSAPWRTVGVAVAGAGLAAIIAGGVLGGYALKQRDESHCAGTVCPDDASAATLRSAKSSANVSTAMMAGGGLLMGGGVAVWLFARPGQGNAANAQLGLAPVPGGAMIAAAWCLAP